MMRLSAALTGLAIMLSQLALAPGLKGIECRALAGAGSMRGMDMPGTPHSTAKVISSQSDEEQAPHAPCDSPASAAACSSMPACAPGMIARISTSPYDPAVTTDKMSAVVLKPLSETKSPELPPPRA